VILEIYNNQPLTIISLVLMDKAVGVVPRKYAQVLQHYLAGHARQLPQPAVEFKDSRAHKIISAAIH
jgi:hypothetical protein